MIRRETCETSRRGFTLVELLITVSIIAIMATMVLFAMFQAQDAARAQKTRTLIAKLNNIVLQRYDEYRTRRIPYQFPPLKSQATADKLAYAREIARARMDCLHDLMRMEMPDRWSDVSDPPVAPYAHGLASTIMSAYPGPMQRPSQNAAYFAKYSAGTPSRTNQGAECLYMIVMTAVAQQGDGRDAFKASDTGDTDSDGYPEFIDGWNNPIEFIRWAPGYISPLQSPIRLEGSVAGGSQEVTVSVSNNFGPRLSQTPGSYVGGAIAFLHPSKDQIDTQLMGRITGYKYDNSAFPPTVTFTCSTPSYTTQKPFNGSSPTNSEFLVLQPDPFDPRGVYPDYSAISIPTYAIYPLIISKGPDRAMGVKDGAGGSSVLQYVNERLNPFYVAPPVNEPYGLMLGSVPKIDDGEPLWKLGCHLDNITNHDLTAR